MFNQEFTILARDIGYETHLDHVSLLRYLQETRIRYLNSIGYAENNIDGHGSILVVTKLLCNYQKECLYGDIITVNLELYKESELKLIFKYRVTKDSQVIATAEITTAFLNSNKKIIKIPNNILPS